MFSRIKFPALKKMLTLATPSTKKLVEAGVQGKYTFSDLLAECKWFGTRDFNLALIIIALYAYCLTKDDLKEIAKKAINKDKSDEKGLRSTLGALRHGNGPKLAEYLKKDFDEDAQKKILYSSINNTVAEGNTFTVVNSPLANKVFENGLFKQAKKIKPWKINARDVDYCIRLLEGEIKKEKSNEELIFAAEMLKSTENKLNVVDKTADKLIHDRRAEINELKKELEASKHLVEEYEDEVDTYFNLLKKLNQERDNLQTELNKSNLTIEEQAKKIQEFENKKAKMRDNIHEYIGSVMAMSTENMLHKNNEDISKAESKKYKETLKKFENLKKEATSLKKSMDDFDTKIDKKPFILSNGNPFTTDINKKRRKSMNATTFAPKSFSAPTIDELKKAKKSLKPTKSDKSSK